MKIKTKLKQIKKSLDSKLDNIEKEEIPICICCQWKLLHDNPELKEGDIPSKQGQWVAGFLPHCRECINQCDPNEPTCHVNSETGKDRTLDAIIEWIMEDE